MKLPSSTNAAVLVEQRACLELWTVDLPDELDVGQVLVRVHYSGICGSQLGEIDGVKGPDDYLPHLLGHEGAGEVIAVGLAVRAVKVGDRVVLHWRPAPGIQANPPRYMHHGMQVNAGWVTTFNNYAVVSENRLTAVPSDTDLKVAALLGCAVTTGFGVVVNDAKLSIGESVVVYGAGGVGLNIVQAASLVSAYPIVAVDLFDSRLELARFMGATHVINGKSQDVDAAIANALGGRNLDCFIDNTGRPHVIELGYTLISSPGRVVLVGVPRVGEPISIYSLPFHFGKQLRGSHGGDAQPATDIPRYLNLYHNERIQLDELITEVVPLAAVNDAIHGIRNGEISGRCLIALS